MPASTLASVLLPAPFSPHSAWHDPAATSNVIPSSARTPGNHLPTSSRRRTGAAGAIDASAATSADGALGSSIATRTLLQLQVRLGDVGESPVGQLAGPAPQVRLRHAHRLHRHHGRHVLLR